MKFGQQLVTHLTPEWRKQYIRYEELKSMLYNMVLEAPGAGSGEVIDSEERQRYFTQMDEKFFAECEQELTKINLFFTQKMAEAQGKFHELTHEMEAFKQLIASKGAQGGAMDRLRRTDSIREMKKEHTKTAQELKFAFSEFYLSLVLLQNYQQLNGTGFRKILKKHDKLVGNERGLDWRVSRVEKSPFFLNREIESLINNTETMVINELEGGNRQAGMKRLKVPPLSEKQNSSTTFALGLYLGCFLVLAVIIVLSLILPIDRPKEPKWVGVRLFRGFFVLFVDVWLMGLNMYGWAEAGVNHVLIFEIDPRQHLTYQSLMKISSLLCMVWALCVVGYLYAHVIGVSPLVFPLILMAVCVIWFCNPFPKMEDTFHRSSRFWLLRHCFYCFTAPLHHVSFADFWLGDQMNSLVTTFLDMQYFICFYATEVDYSGGWMMSTRPYNASAATVSNSSHGAMPWGVVDYASGKDMCMSAAGVRAFVSIIPATVRFLQCLRRFRDTRLVHPHLVNAGKYSTTYFVVIFGGLNRWYRHQQPESADILASPFFYLWILAYIISFTYTFLWDIFMDWGLIDPKAPKEARFLREEMIYGSKWYYYGAIVEDFVLRLMWVMNVSLGEAWTLEADLLMCITAPFEILRRFVWNYLRLENEHVNNCGQFRAVRDISVKPIRKGDLEQLIAKIDRMDGVSHRGDQLAAKVRKRKAARARGKRFPLHRKLTLPILSRIHQHDHQLSLPMTRETHHKRVSAEV